MSLDSDIALLQRVPLFSDLPTEQIRLLAFSAVRLELAADQVLFREGARAKSGYVVASGGIELTRRAGSRKVVANCESGTLIGELALLIETKRPATATAMVASQVLEIDRKLILRMLSEYPQVAVEVARRHAGAAAGDGHRSRPGAGGAQGNQADPGAAVGLPVRREPRRAITGTWSDGRGQPRACAHDLGALQAVGEVRRHPDVVEPAAAVAGLPVGGAIAPPGVDLLVHRHEVADGIDPAADLAHVLQPLGLDRRVADDREELLCDHTSFS